MTKILIVNPNTTASMTATIAAAAREVAATGTEIVAVTSSMGPASIEGFYDEAFAVPGLIQRFRMRPTPTPRSSPVSTTLASTRRGPPCRIPSSAFARRRW